MPDFSGFDARGYRTVAPREGYDRWARNYEDTVEDAMDLALLERVEVDWAAAGRTADLGCGTGRTGAWLKAHGVSCPVDEHLADLGPLYAEATSTCSVTTSPRAVPPGSISSSCRSGSTTTSGWR